MSATSRSTRSAGEARAPGRQAGSTLVEALVVVALTAMIGAIAFPELGRAVDAEAFEQAVSGLRADLRIARAQAIRTGAPVELVVAQDGHGYGWTPGPRRGLVGGIALEPGRAEVRFYPDGSADGGALALRNARSRVRLDLDPATGLVRTAL